MTKGAVPGTLKESTVRSSIWAVVEYGGGQALRLGSTLLLARLILPGEFALMVLVQVLMQGIQMFGDFGIGPSLIQNRKGLEPDFYNTAWTIQVLRGVVVWLILCVVAYPFAYAYPEYDTDLLATLIIVVGFTVILTGLNSTGLPLLRRKMQLQKLAFVELLTQSVSIVVMVSFALVEPSVWALVAGGYAGVIIRLVLSHRIAPHPRNLFRYDRTHAKSLFRFGRWILLSTMLAFFASHADRLIFGQILIKDELGVYNMAVTLATIMALFVGQLSGSVVFPAVSLLLQQQTPLDQSYRKLRAPLLTLGAVSTAGLISVGPYAVEILFPPHWWAAGWQVQILAGGSWIMMLEGTIGVMHLAHGRPVILAVGNMFKICAMLILIPVGFHWHGVPGAIAGYAMTELPRYLTSMVALARGGISCWRHDLLMTVLIVSTVFFSMAIVDWTGAAEHGRLAAFVVGGLAVVLPWAPYTTNLVVRTLRR